MNNWRDADIKPRNKAIMKLDISFHAAISAAVVALCVTGCGEKPPPPPPLSRSALVLETISAMESKNHDMALRKIARLRAVEPSNVFLANLETLETNNSVIAQAQLKIGEGALNEALAVVEDGIREYGRPDELMKARKKLAVAAKVEQLLKIFDNPRDSAQLAAAAKALNKIAKVYPPAAAFAPIAKKQLARAQEMNKFETEEAISMLCSQIDQSWKNGDQDIDILYAVLEIERPDHPLLKTYMDYLGGDPYAEPEPYPDEDIFAEDEADTGGDAGDGDGASTEEPATESAAPQEPKTKEKPKSWWDKFSF